MSIIITPLPIPAMQLVVGLRRLLKHVHGGRSPRHYDAGWSDALDEVEYRLEMDLRMRRLARPRGWCWCLNSQCSTTANRLHLPRGHTIRVQYSLVHAATVVRSLRQLLEITDLEKGEKVDLVHIAIYGSGNPRTSVDAFFHFIH